MLEQRTSCLIEEGSQLSGTLSLLKLWISFFLFYNPLRLISVVHLQYSSPWNKSTLFIKVNLITITLNSTDERIRDLTLLVARAISPVKMSFFYLLKHHFRNSAILCYWPLRLCCQKLFALQDLNSMKWGSQECLPFLSFQDSRARWQAQTGFLSVVLFSKAHWKDRAAQKVQVKPMWMHAQLSWIPTPALKPQRASGYVCVCQTWNLVTELGIRVGDNYSFFSSSRVSNEWPACVWVQLWFWVPIAFAINFYKLQLAF